MILLYFFIHSLSRILIVFQSQPFRKQHSKPVRKDGLLRYNKLIKKFHIFNFHF